MEALAASHVRECGYADSRRFDSPPKPVSCGFEPHLLSGLPVAQKTLQGIVERRQEKTTFTRQGRDRSAANAGFNQSGGSDPSPERYPGSKLMP